MGLPLLIVQGGKDFQVTPQNGIDAWKEALDPSLPVEYAYYENMTHLLFDLQGESTASVADYVNPGPVSTALLDDWPPGPPHRRRGGCRKMDRAGNAFCTP